jgi:hypothetical protein
VGSAAWGWVAEKATTPVALSLASLGLLAGLPLARRFQIVSGARLDLSPAMTSGLTRSAPVVIVEPRPEPGPVLISIEYRIDPPDAPAFRTTMHDLKTIRLRDGAMRWGLFADPLDPARYLETFLVESWAEYLRQRERMTMNDLTVRDKAHSFHRGEVPPPISRMIYTPTDRAKPADSVSRKP